MGDTVFLTVSPIKGLRRFNVRGKLSPRYIGPYEIIEKLNLVASRLDLPIELDDVHDIFRISRPRKYNLYLDHVLSLLSLSRIKHMKSVLLRY